MTDRAPTASSPLAPADLESGGLVRRDGLEEVVVAFQELRARLADLFVAVQVDPTQTRETARKLGLNRGLVWRLTRVVRATDVAAAVSDVPGRASMARFIAACRERGAPEHELDAISHAIARFERLTSACSGDRKTLAMLMSNRSDSLDSGEQERARRKLFEGGCTVWGVQAAVRFVSVFLFPAPDDPSMMDVGHVTGYVGFRRMRAIPWPLSFEAVMSRRGDMIQFEKAPLDPTGATEGSLQLIPRFCDPPDPAIVVSTIGNVKRFELAEGPVGNAGLATVVFGTYLRHLIPRAQSADHQFASFNVLLCTPVERLIFDMFVHRDIHLDGIPETNLCDRLTHPHPPADDDVYRLAMPCAEQPFALGRGASGALTPHIPFYPRLVEFVCQRVGHPAEAFRGSRFEMTYPPIPTAPSRRFPLADPGSRAAD